MILWGVLALTIFGCTASFCEFFFGLLDTVKGYMDAALDPVSSVAPDSYPKSLNSFYEVHSRLSLWTRVFEILTIAGWIAYVVGISRFRSAQLSDQGRWLTGNIHTACWLGLISMAVTFVGSFVGILGLLFRFAGWVINLISLFKFRSAFNHLNKEDSWNDLARRGAKSLRTSYTFGIILAFYPLIVSLSVMLVAFGSLSNLPGIMRDTLSNGMESAATLIGGFFAFGILLACTAVILWICQICFLLSGWSKIKNGSLVDTPDYHFVTDSSTATVLVTMLAIVVITGLTAWYCLSPISRKDTSRHRIRRNRIGYAESSGKSRFTEEDRPMVAPPPMKAPPIVEIIDVVDDEYETMESEETENEPAGDEYTNHYTGTINGSMAIEMTLITDGGAYYCGEYFYTQNKTPIQLRGQLTDDYEHLVLEEYVGMNMTGTFEGTLTNNGYSGTWTSADGENSYPFSITRK